MGTSEEPNSGMKRAKVPKKKYFRGRLKAIANLMLELKFFTLSMAIDDNIPKA
jgi:hypothetical protein